MKLDAWLKKEHSLPERLQVVAGLCSALDDAHRRGVVRGGLEPTAIDVGTDGSCRLDSDPPRLGSPYAAPELADGGPPTSKGEIYSAGVIGYEVLSGRPPFDSDPPRPLQDLQADLPRDLTDAVTACLERDPEWRPADLAYLLAVVQSLQNEVKAAAPIPASTPARRVNPPPRAILEVAPRMRWDDRSALTRALPVVLVAVAIAGTGGAWLWFEVLRPGRTPASGRPSAAPSAPPTTLAQNAAAPLGSPSAPTPPVLPRPAAAPPSSLAATPSVAPLASPRTTSSPEASLPNPRPRANPPPLTTPAAAPALPTPAPPSEALGPANPQPTPEPSLPERDEPAAGDGAQAPLGPATIRAIAPYRLRAGSLHVLDVHGAGLRVDHRARIVPQKKREPEAGFAVTRYQLRNPSLLLVFLQVDAAARPGRYAFSLVDPSGAESNAFTIEIAAR